MFIFRSMVRTVNSDIIPLSFHFRNAGCHWNTSGKFHLRYRAKRYVHSDIHGGRYSHTSIHGGRCTHTSVHGGQKRVAVIGAGISGLCAVKHMLAKNGKFIPTVFERNSQIGGTWVYNEQPIDEFGLPTHSSVYRNLRANSPKQLLAFPDFPFNQEGKESYPHHGTILKYIKSFSDHYCLSDYIQFNTMVQKVCPVRDKHGSVTWEVTYRDLGRENEVHTQQFDAVLVCNGHNHKPRVPEIPGITYFKGNIIHSREYRHPEVYQGQTVLVIGASFSGLDISVDLSASAKQVLLSNREEKLLTKLPSNVVELPDISMVDVKGRAVFNDGTEAEVDSIIYCTGYLYDFPFFSEEVVQVTDNWVTPLYKHLIHVIYHNLLFIGIPNCVTYFPQVHAQSRAAVAILEGKVMLPPIDEMIKDTLNDFKWKREMFNFTKREAHFMGVDDLQWRFNEELASLCQISRLPKIYQVLAADVWHKRTTDFLTFRKRHYFVRSESFEFFDT